MPATGGTKRRCTATFQLETSDSADLTKFDTESQAPTTACRYDVEVDALMKSDGGQGAQFEDVLDSEDLALFACDGTTCPPEGTSAIKSDQAPRGAHTHSNTLCPVFGPNPDAVQRSEHCLPDGTFELQASSTAKIDRP